MRALLLPLVFLAACAEPAPPMAQIAYLCSVDGKEGAIVIQPDGRTSVRETGRACDYAAWRARVDEHGLRYRSFEPGNYGSWQTATVSAGRTP